MILSRFGIYRMWKDVRRDVKIVNLSLLNTDWYVRQLKNNDPYGVGTVKIRIPDARINPTDLRPTQWSPTDITIATPKYSSANERLEIIDQYAIKDTSVLCYREVNLENAKLIDLW